MKIDKNVNGMYISKTNFEMGCDIRVQLTVKDTTTITLSHDEFDTSITADITEIIKQIQTQDDLKEIIEGD
jgi:hypothetical protein